MSRKSAQKDQHMAQVMRRPEGGRINRSKPVTFSFDGREYSGYEGDTLASALWPTMFILSDGRSNITARAASSVPAVKSRTH